MTIAMMGYGDAFTGWNSNFGRESRLRTSPALSFIFHATPKINDTNQAAQCQVHDVMVTVQEVKCGPAGSGSETKGVVRSWGATG